MEKDKALQRYAKSQQSLKTILDHIPDDQKATVLVEGTWTVKELFCHFIGWDKSLIEPLTEFIKTGEFLVSSLQDHDAYNAIQTSIRQSLPLEKIIEEEAQTSLLLISLVSGLDQAQCEVKYPAPWGGESTIPGMLAGLAWHIDDHLKDVEAALSNNRTGK